MNCNIKQNNQHTNKPEKKTKQNPKQQKKVLFGEGSTKKKERNKKSHLKVDNKYWNISVMYETI